MADRVRRVPVFGPKMSPEIFQAKWIEKNASLFYHKFLDRGEDDPYLAAFYKAGVEHLFHFHAQAAEHHLSSEDFAESQFQQVNARLTNQENIMANFNQPNPFVSAHILLMVLDTSLRRKKALKQQGEKLNGTVAWQDIPLVVRRQINNVFEAVEKARKVGWWNVPEKEQEEWMESHRAVEARSMQHRA